MMQRPLLPVVQLLYPMLCLPKSSWFGLQVVSYFSAPNNLYKSANCCIQVTIAVIDCHGKDYKIIETETDCKGSGDG